MKVRCSGEMPVDRPRDAVPPSSKNGITSLLKKEITMVDENVNFGSTAVVAAYLDREIERLSAARAALGGLKRVVVRRKRVQKAQRPTGRGRFERTAAYRRTLSRAIRASWRRRRAADGGK